MGAFAERLAEPGVVEQCSLAGTFGFMAYHGGELEKQTDVIATEAAASSGASLYVVRHPADDHITSTLVRRADSDLLDRFLDHVEVVVTVHGYGRESMFTSLLLGGTNRPLARVAHPARAGDARLRDHRRPRPHTRRPAWSARRQPGEPATWRWRAARAATAGARARTALGRVARRRTRAADGGPHRSVGGTGSGIVRRRRRSASSAVITEN
ncbi:MAG: poly-gamma-glutamate hydrolase family protein [Ilumatobacteraceae bacterium]